MEFNDDCSDEDLMLAYQSGHYTAFELLYDRYKGRLFAFLIKKLRKQEEAEELFQLIFMKFHKSRDLYNPRLNFAPWLFTIAQNTLFDHYRKQKRILEDSNSELIELLPSPLVKNFEPTSLDILNEQQRKAIELRYENDLSFDEIAESLKTSTVNVRQIISRAIKKIRTTNSKKSL